jgi:hypothetical protein
MDKCGRRGHAYFYHADGAYFASLDMPLRIRLPGYCASIERRNSFGKGHFCGQGEKGLPGEIKAIFENPNDALGVVTENTDYGIIRQLD